MSLVRNSTNTVASNRPKKTSNFNAPAGEIAEIMLTPPRSPVTSTTGLDLSSGVANLSSNYRRVF
jgi:hypothetical protein